MSINEANHQVMILKAGVILCDYQNIAKRNDKLARLTLQSRPFTSSSRMPRPLVAGDSEVEVFYATKI